MRGSSHNSVRSAIWMDVHRKRMGKLLVTPQRHKALSQGL
jgi:hypothetical protein